jgi:hypothetical protein
VAINQIKSNTGFITFEPSGVLAANKISQLISHTINTNASGQLVINHVIIHIHLTFFKADNINSILNHTKNINIIIQEPQRNDSIKSHHIIIDEIVKKSKVIVQTKKSNFCRESLKIVFINY